MPPPLEDQDENESSWKEIRHHPRSSTTVNGIGAILIGFPFAAAGMAVILVAAEVIHLDKDQFNGPRWMAGIAGSVFLIVGLLLILHGIRGVLRAGNVKALANRFLNDPWNADYSWNAMGVNDDQAGRLVKIIGGVIFLGLFLIPFNGWAFASEVGFSLIQIVVGIFDIILIAGVSYATYLTFQRMKYGQTRLRFNTFPFFLGETLDLEFVSPKGIGLFEKMTLTLRCIQERYEIRGVGKNRRQKVISYETYCDQQTSQGPGEYRASDASLPITFSLPASGLETDLKSRPPRYWELEVTAKTPGVDFKATYLVPVYKDPN